MYPFERVGLRQEKLVPQVEAQQRNMVFPDTVETEGESYRGIATRPLTPSGKIGFSLLAAMVAILVFVVIYGIVVTSTQSYSDRQIRAVSVALTLGTIFGGAALFIRILYLAVRLGVHQFAAQTS